MILVDLGHFFHEVLPVFVVILDFDLRCLEGVDVHLRLLNQSLVHVHPLLVLLQLHFRVGSSRLQILQHVPMLSDLSLKACRLAANQFAYTFDLF